MFSITNLKFIAIIIALIVMLSAIIILASSQPNSSSPLLPPPSLNPTSYPNLAPPSISPAASINNTSIDYSEEYLKQQETITQQEQSLSNQALIVSKFTDTLPYKGSSINVTYNIYDNQVYLEYIRGNKDQALAEFVSLLKQNQVENLNWLYNLKIVEK